MESWFLPVVKLVAAVFLTSCVALSQLYVGKIVDGEDIVTLQNGFQKDITWETFDVVLEFEYELKGETLTITGKGRLGDHYQAVYTHLRYFDAFLFQVDRDGRVLETVRLPTIMMSRPDDSFTFKKILVTYPETTGLSFGYSGEAFEREKSEPVFIQFFHHTPFRKQP